MGELLIEYGKHTEVYLKWVLHFCLSLSMPTLENFSLFEIPGILVNVLVVGYMLYAVWRRGGGAASRMQRSTQESKPRTNMTNGVDQKPESPRLPWWMLPPFVEQLFVLVLFGLLAPGAWAASHFRDSQDWLPPTG